MCSVHKGLKSSNIKLHPELNNKSGLSFSGLKRDDYVILL